MVPEGTVLHGPDGKLTKAAIVGASKRWLDGIGGYLEPDHDDEDVCSSEEFFSFWLSPAAA
jgi:hypothetical protein